jgi:hypothetical protein
VIKNLTEYQHVPSNYIGVWQRALLETATTKDDSSLVLWMQTAQYHIDIRIPANRPQLPQVEKLEDYSNEELQQLATQCGFAGITQVTSATKNSSDICQWHREIDFQPKTNVPDIGKMVFTDKNTVIETGIDGAYLEVWRRLEDSQQPCWFKFTTGKNRKGQETPAYLMRAGKFVAYARPRQVALPKNAYLIDAIISHNPQREQLLDWLDMEISFGEMLDEKYWKIKHSTLPFKEQLILI